MTDDTQETNTQEQSTNTPLPDITRRRVLQGAAAAGAVGMLSGVGSAQEDPQGYIVGLESRVSYSVASVEADSVYRKLDFGSIGKAVAGNFSKSARADLEGRDDVRYVEPDKKKHLTAETLPWGIDRVDADKVHDKGRTGKGVDISIIDTGIDSDHPDLVANLGKGKSFVDYTDKWDDDLYHGTHCAGIADAVDNTEGVIGVSTEATLHAAKAFGKDGTGSTSDIVAAIEWTANNDYDVASMSFGGDGSQTEKDACQYAVDKGVLLVSSAGNAGEKVQPPNVSSPADYETVIAVSATDKDDTIASYSSTGPAVELAAPGTNILSTFPKEEVDQPYGKISGTSMACPHVSGAGAQLMANGFSNTEVRQRLNETAEDIGLSKNKQGNGLLDVEAAVPGPKEDQVAEFGTVSGNHTWQTVNLTGSYENPVVLMGPLTYNGINPSHIRVRNVKSGSFEWRVEEWNYLDGNHPNGETAHYAVVEKGVNTLEDGTQLLAGSSEVDHVFETYEFGERFDKVPISVATTQTFNESSAIVADQRSVGRDSLKLRVDEQESKKDSPHNDEEMGALLVEPGTYSVGGTKFEARRMPDTVTDEWFPVTFSRSYTNPVFVASIETFDGWQPCELRYRNLTETGAEIFIEEEQSKDPETNHTTERVDIMVFEGESSPSTASGSSSAVLHGTTESGSDGSLTDTNGS